METKISSRTRNDLLKRRELTFEIVHEKGGTVPRAEVREQLAAVLKANIDCVYIKRMETKTGSRVTVGEANVYDSIEEAKYTEPDHIVSRNMPRQESQESE